MTVGDRNSAKRSSGIAFASRGRLDGSQLEFRLDSLVPLGSVGGQLAGGGVRYDRMLAGADLVIQGCSRALASEGINANFVASNMPIPIGVEIEARYGTRSRVPPRGASQISVSCCAAR